MFLSTQMLTNGSKRRKKLIAIINNEVAQKLIAHLVANRVRFVIDSYDSPIVRHDGRESFVVNYKLKQYACFNTYQELLDYLNGKTSNLA